MEITPPKKSPKFQQVIWLDGETFQWIIGLSNDKGVAPNYLIGQILRAVYEAQLTGKPSPIMVVEKKVKVYKCPFCVEEFPSLGQWYDHVLEQHKDKIKVESL